VGGVGFMADPEFKFTVELLKNYSTAALQNAAELLEEATLLSENGHAARTYFLAVASIEETGKALQAFDAQGRNLADSAVTARLRRSMEDHSQKITSAFTAILLSSPDVRKAVMPIVEVMIHLKRGREPSMYTDIRYSKSTVQMPSAMVRDVAAKDCIRLARDCLRHACKHIAEKTPEVRSGDDDQLFAMKSGQL
jgi:AbiV family abortive infection protein